MLGRNCYLTLSVWKNINSECNFFNANLFSIPNKLYFRVCTSKLILFEQIHMVSASMTYWIKGALRVNVLNS